jgi:KipI family sensor histidine kinase inhibitor
MSDFPPRIREAGDSAILLELEPVVDADVNARAHRIASAVRAARISGVRDVVSTARSVSVYFDPLVTDPSIVVDALKGAARQGGSAAARARTVEIPVAYGDDDGPDLEAVAARAGISKQEVVDRHSSPTYRVFMLGFLPGFAYLGSVDPLVAMPRRVARPASVPAGAVGINGWQTGVYPMASPSGWQIIGRTVTAMFDAAGSPPSLLAPGDHVRFVPASRVGRQPQAVPPHVGGTMVEAPVSSRWLTVVTPGLLTTIQDLGRWGHQSLGVAVAGPMDAASHRLANRLVGNPAHAAALEVTVRAPELRVDHDAVVAIAGADLAATLDGVPMPMNTAIGCPAGSVIRWGERRCGARAYVACDGGIATAPVLGSRATHLASGLGGLGGRTLEVGDQIPLLPGAGPGIARRHPTLESVVTGGARLRILLGPQDDFFTPSAVETLQRTRFTLTPESDRTRYRLAGRARIARAPDREMISDSAYIGGIQVPLSGDPILLMADRRTTGSYPQIATVITADLPLAGQLVAGDWVEFELCTRAEALAALTSQEARLFGVE